MQLDVVETVIIDTCHDVLGHIIHKGSHPCRLLLSLSSLTRHRKFDTLFRIVWYNASLAADHLHKPR